MCTVSYQNAPLKKTRNGRTATTCPSRRVIPPGWFIQLLAAMTAAAPPRLASTTGTPVQKWAQGGSRFQP